MISSYIYIYMDICVHSIGSVSLENPDTVLFEGTLQTDLGVGSGIAPESLSNRPWLYMS